MRLGEVKHRWLGLALIFAMGIAGLGWLMFAWLGSRALPATTGAPTLWDEYCAQPDLHPNIPNVSYSGYAYGEKPIPEPDIILTISPEEISEPLRHNVGAGQAVGQYLQRAIDISRQQGKLVAVQLPPGEWPVYGRLTIPAGNVILRGAGVDKTTLRFHRSLDESYYDGEGSWSYTGGLIWVEQPTPDDLPVIGTVNVLSGQAGSTLITVDQPEKLVNAAGRLVTLTWPLTRAVAREIYSPQYADGMNWDAWSSMKPGELETWYSNNLVVAIQGNQVRLKKPLRLDVQAESKVYLTQRLGDIERVGIEAMTVAMPEHPVQKHLQDKGFNGVFFKRVQHGWVKNVKFVNCDNGLITEQSNNCTFQNLTFSGQKAHHCAYFRGCSHDNLMDGFTIENPVHHGVSSQDVSSGNVWKNGLMYHGTLDLHRGMSFDSVRTNIRMLEVDGSGGGAEDQGPYCGRRIVTWNVAVAGAKKARWTQPLQTPEQYVMGALVGIQGLDLLTQQKKLWAMPLGDKGTRVENWGLPAVPPDLHAAQLALRLGRAIPHPALPTATTMPK